MEKIRIELYCGIKYDLYQLSYLHLLEINDDFLRKNDTSDIIQELDIDIDHISDLVDTNIITALFQVAGYPD
jgi:ATP-binding cassette subfamily B protein